MIGEKLAAAHLVRAIFGLPYCFLSFLFHPYSLCVLLEVIRPPLRGVFFLPYIDTLNIVL